LSSGNYRYNSYGSRQALRHIAQAEILSSDLGGTDKDVKSYFFNLSTGQLTRVLDVYRKRFGTPAYEYACETYPLWKSGSRKMSGLVATRLFKILPGLMPIEEKHKLVKSLWLNLTPRGSSIIFTIGPDVSFEALQDALTAWIYETVVGFQLPANLLSRFRWLSDGDVKVQESLLNHFLEQEKSIMVDALGGELKHLQERFRTPSQTHVSKASYSFKLSNHSLSVVFSKKVQGIHYNLVESDNSPAGCLFREC